MQNIVCVVGVWGGGAGTGTGETDPVLGGNTSKWNEDCTKYVDQAATRKFAKYALKNIGV
eukprot:SAG31_NODE_436_length_15717_cov_5.420412_4_plen_60_part_00